MAGQVDETKAECEEMTDRIWKLPEMPENMVEAKRARDVLPNPPLACTLTLTQAKEGWIGIGAPTDTSSRISVAPASPTACGSDVMRCSLATMGSSRRVYLCGGTKCKSKKWDKTKCLGRVSNPRPYDLQSYALPLRHQD